MEKGRALRGVSDVCYGDGMKADSLVYRVTMHVMKLCAHSPCSPFLSSTFSVPAPFYPSFCLHYLESDSSYKEHFNQN